MAFRKGIKNIIPALAITRMNLKAVCGEYFRLRCSKKSGVNIRGTILVKEAEARKKPEIACFSFFSIKRERMTKNIIRISICPEEAHSNTGKGFQAYRIAACGAGDSLKRSRHVTISMAVSRDLILVTPGKNICERPKNS